MISSDINIVRWLYSIISLLWLLAASLASAEPIPYEIQPDIVVVGWDRLSLDNQHTLQSLLAASPRAMAPWLRVITVDDTPIPEPYASEECWPNGVFLSHRPCGFNMLNAGNTLENQFPPDAPIAQWVRIFTAVAIHEYGHQIGHGTDAEQGWVDRLIAEAGNDPSHYLRSMLPAGYFRQNPQEFIASMWNQWGTCSLCTLKLALARWEQDDPHLLNQVILLLALSGFRHGMLNDNQTGTVIAYHMQGETPVAEFWSVGPWRCGGPSRIAGPGFVVVVTTNEQCRATALSKKIGL